MTNTELAELRDLYADSPTFLELTYKHDADTMPAEAAVKFVAQHGHQAFIENGAVVIPEADEALTVAAGRVEIAELLSALGY